MSEHSLRFLPPRLAIAVTVLALSSWPAVGGPLPGPVPTVPPPAPKPALPPQPAIPPGSLGPTIEFSLAEGVRTCMDPGFVPALRYRVSDAKGGVRFVQITRILSDGVLTDGPYLWSPTPPLPAAKEESRVPDANASRYPRTLVGYKLEAGVGGASTVYTRRVSFSFLRRLTLDPDKMVYETISSTNGRGGAVVAYEIPARITGADRVLVVGASVPPSADPRSRTKSDAVILEGTPTRLRWTINWPDGTESIWRGRRTHLLTAIQDGPCGRQTIDAGPLPGGRR